MDGSEVKNNSTQFDAKAILGLAGIVRGTLGRAAADDQARDSQGEQRQVGRLGNFNPAAAPSVNNAPVLSRSRRSIACSVIAGSCAGT